MTDWTSRIKFDENGLVPVVVQDTNTHEVLTLAYMNAESLRLTIEIGETWFWSRSRKQLWHKGATSGNTQRVVDIHPDCDNDALVVLVEPSGPACHTGAVSCFNDRVPSESAHETEEWPVDAGAVLVRLEGVISQRHRDRPPGSYTTYLFDKGLDKILKKIGEESAETIIAAKNSNENEIVSETADLIYHLFVLLVQKGIAFNKIAGELDRRANEKTGK